MTFKYQSRKGKCRKHGPQNKSFNLFCDFEITEKKDQYIDICKIQEGSMTILKSVSIEQIHRFYFIFSVSGILM